MNSNFWENSKLRLVDFVFFFDRQVTLFEEFMLLKEFEKRENSFANKVNTKLSEKEEMQEKVLRKTSQRCAVCFFLQTLIVVWQTRQNIFIFQLIF